MKIYSSKKAALNSLPVGKYKTGLYCTGKYKTGIKEMTPVSENIKGLYKSYRSDEYGGYVKVYYLAKGE